MGSNDVVKKISEYFAVEITQAETIYDELKEMNDTNIKTKLSNAKTNVKINIAYTVSYELNGKYYYTCYLENITNKDYLDNIIIIISKLLSVYDIIYGSSEIIEISDADKDYISQSEFTPDIGDDDIESDGEDPWGELIDEMAKSDENLLQSKTDTSKTVSFQL